MKSRALRAFFALAPLGAAALLLVGTAVPAPTLHRPRVLAIHFDGDLEVNPVTEGYVDSQLSHAQSNGYAAAVILLDTPGGLLASMRKIVQHELASPIPVIVYVSPDGARAASAGVWISEAADVLAMAPQTNIGSSTPISGTGQNIGKDLRRKVVNDAAASLTALAQEHGRNTAWPALAVRQASNLTREEGARDARDRRGRAEPARPPAPARRDKDEAQGVRPPPRRRADRPGEPLIHAPAEHADRPEPDLDALPRGHRGDRLRDLPPGRRAARRARRRRAPRSRSSVPSSSRSRGPASRSSSSESHCSRSTRT